MRWLDNNAEYLKIVLLKWEEKLTRVISII